MKSYKIETNGLNEAILHKAVELGYDDKTSYNYHLSAKYLFLYSHGLITSSNKKYVYDESDHPQISAHDFLRLNWEPKVGDRIKKTGFYLYGDIRECGTIISIKASGYCLIGFDGDEGDKNTYGQLGLWPGQMIPIHPKKEQPKEKPESEIDRVFKDLVDGEEKPDAYILDSFQALNNEWFLRASVRIENKNLICDIPVIKAHEYNLISESDYKAKYPDKLMFKNWEVKVDRDNVKIGCVGVPKDTVQSFMAVCDICYEHATNPKELFNFLYKHKKTLGL